jgi:REP element-mobilizing transposase RayT
MPTPPLPHGRDLRKGRVSIPSQIYHVTTATRGRLPVFADFRGARLLVGALREAAALHRAETLAYVVMPDHLHWLMQLAEGYTLERVVGGVKSVCAHRLGARIWQHGFHDRALRRDEDIQAAARYIVANPLRAGLVEHLGDYPHWDAIWLS